MHSFRRASLGKSPNSLHLSGGEWQWPSGPLESSGEMPNRLGICFLGSLTALLSNNLWEVILGILWFYKTESMVRRKQGTHMSCVSLSWRLSWIRSASLSSKTLVFKTRSLAFSRNWKDSVFWNPKSLYVKCFPFWWCYGVTLTFSK